MSAPAAAPSPLCEQMQGAHVQLVIAREGASLVGMNEVAKVGPPAAPPIAGDQARDGWVNSGVGNY